MSVDRVTITCLFYGQTCQNVLNFSNGDGSMTPAAVCAEVRDFWIGVPTTNGVRQWQSNSITWVSIACQRRETPLPAPTVLAVSLSGAQGANNEMITVLCTILKFQTGIAGRQGRGRSYVPGLLNGMTTNGLIDDTWDAFGATALANMNARFKSGGTGPLTLLVGPKNGMVVGDYIPVTNISRSQFVGIQRRRNVGFGV